MKNYAGSKVKIKNIYYMLTYVWDQLNDDGFSNINTEEFEDALNLLAEVLVCGVKRLVKRGLHCDYIDVSRELSNLKGKIEFSDSMSYIMKKESKLVCSYDEFSENNIYNQIIKAILTYLHKTNKVKCRNEIKRLLTYFETVEIISLKSILWTSLVFKQNNRMYRMLIGICHLIYDGLLVNENKGEVEFQTYLKDDNMAKLYEKFVYEYFYKHHKNLTVRHNNKLQWDSTGDRLDLLPKMETDITLAKENRILIIDTKFYSKMFITHNRSDKSKIISQNLYQIYAYINNTKGYESVSGMLLYPCVDELVNETYNIQGNPVHIWNVDLNTDFSEIKSRLDEVTTFV